MHDRDNLHLVADDSIQHGVGEPVKDEAPADSRFHLGETSRRFRDAVDALLDGCLKPLRGARVSSQIPEERGPGLDLGTLLDPELPAGHVLLAREDS